MKWFTIMVVATFLFTGPCMSQTSEQEEFTIHSNGLIYSPADMKILGSVVDSLNLRFKTCDLNAGFYSHPQANIRYLEFRSKTNNLQQVKKDLENGKDYSYIVSTYNDLIHSMDSNKLLIKVGDPQETYYLKGSAAKGYSTMYDLKNTAFLNNNRWAVIYSPKDKYSKEYALDCYYLPGPFISKKIPDAYARLIQYVDCMIDTNSTVMLGKANYDRGFSTPACAGPVNKYLNQKMNLKKSDKYDYRYITEAKIEYAKAHLMQDNDFIELLKTACEKCIEQQKGNGGLEVLAGLMISKNKQLEMMRHHRVVGYCSQDQSPRIHARNIAMMAAETHSWDIFLRAHLDIMNDRFERMSDGNYAWGGRKTYLKELEELGLNVIDLMFGLTLRAQNVANNHYHGTVWRLGRALAESKDRLAFEERIQPMMTDENLDAFNRGLLFLLYRSYLDHLTDEQEKSQKTNALKLRFPENFRE